MDGTRAFLNRDYIGLVTNYAPHERDCDDLPLGVPPVQPYVSWGGPYSCNAVQGGAEQRVTPPSWLFPRPSDNEVFWWTGGVRAGFDYPCRRKGECGPVGTCAGDTGIRHWLWA